jgi:Protein of unknown function (DUF2840)
MIDAASNRPTGPKSSPPNGRPVDDLTQVHLTWIKGRIEHWIRFGSPSGETILDAERRVLSFPPDNVIAFVRWASNDFGTIQSRADILRTVPKGAAHQTIPCVRPGGELLLRLHGWPVVEQVLKAIDAIEARGIDPTNVAPEHWRHVHNRLSIGHEPGPYSAAQHRAWVLRKRAGS